MGERRGTKALELWCRRMTDGYPGVKIDNMTTSWRDGLAFCAMIHHFRPDLIEFEKLNKKDVYFNNELAFTTAEKYLGIPALLDADDMAAYEVPDRLSILTYLSQFYQVFAAQDSPNRLKRSSPSTADKSPITKTPGPPSKMAHVVGVPRRDPCQKCKLPVFLAERLTVGKRTFHRTCLKCARCGSQLTPGSFYETEVDDEYCCETCPDEEEIAAIAATAAGIAPANTDIDSESDVVLRNAGSRKPASAAADATTAATTGAGRSSILARLAFFEKNNDNPSMRLSSCTDEEKTRQRAALVDPVSRAKLDRDRYLANDAESDDCTDKSDTLSSAVRRGGAQLELSDTEADDDDDDLRATQAAPPELPKSQPPPIVAFDEPTVQVRSPSKRFTATAQLHLVTTDQAATTDLVANEAQSRQGATDAEDNDNIATSMDERRTIGVSFNLSTPAESTATAEREDSANNNGETGEGGKGGEAVVEVASPARTHAPAEKREGNNLDLSPTNVRDVNVTKEKTAVRDTHTAAAAAQASIPDGLEQMKAELQALDANSSTDPEDVADSHVEVRKKPQPAQLPEDAATTERLSVVRARLQQFEVIANTKNNNINIKSTNLNVKPTSPENLTLSDCIETKSIDKDDRLESQKETEAKANANAIVQLDQELQSESVNIEASDEENDEEKPMEIDSDIAILESRNEVPLSAQTEDESDSSSKNGMVRSIDVKAVRPANDSDGGSAEAAPATAIAAQLDAESSVPKDERTPPTAIARSPAGSPAPAAKGEEYPDNMNPFNSDDDEDTTTNEANKENNLNAAGAGAAGSSATLRAASGAILRAAGEKDNNLNPFDSSDDEIELEKSQNSSSSAGGTPSGKVPPPRPPPPRISRNPFGDDEEGDDDFSRRSSLTSSITKKTPVPTPRTNLSQNPTPEPTPRLSNKTPQVHTPASSVLQNSSDYYGSVNSLSSSSAATTPQALLRNSGSRGSNNSLTSSAGGTIRSRKSRRAPAPPLPVKELFPSTETVNGSKASTPSSSNMGSPKSNRKKRPAPAPPKPARLDASQLQALPPQIKLEQPLGDETNDLASKNLLSYPLQSDLDSKLSDEEKALLEGKQLATSPPSTSKAIMMAMTIPSLATKSARNSLRLIPLDPSLLEDLGADGGQSDDVKHQLAEEETNVVYRRVLVPSSLGTPIHEANPLLDELNVAAHDRQLEKLKDNKEAQNRNRQSQHSAASSGTEDGDGASALYSNKSSHGKWKRRKGPAPALPIPPRRVLQMLPLQEIRHELDIIEVQQQGLEKQGVILEKMIRDRCEGQNGEPLGLAVTTAVADDVGDGRTKATATLAENTPNSKEVEDLILQLFELVNEKNELFRRQAELMYLRRQHRLEQEQADLEYEIRVLMAQPERNKTDTDKSREEALIARLVEVVQLRNEVIDCLEMDRLREAEEDLSIKQRLELHTAQRGSDEESKKSSLRLLSKKEKKKHKESKKLSKSKKIDADKDADETELSASDKPKLKKKKRKFLF